MEHLKNILLENGFTEEELKVQYLWNGLSVKAHIVYTREGKDKKIGVAAQLDPDAPNDIKGMYEHMLGHAIYTHVARSKGLI